MTAPHLRPVPSAPIPIYPLGKDARLDGHSFLKWQFNRWLNSDMAMMASYEVQGVARSLFDHSQNQSPIGIRDVIEKIANVLRGNGFTGSAAIFDSIITGKLAARGPAREQRAWHGTPGDYQAFGLADVDGQAEPLDTRAQAFQKWFGDSKVVDKRGRPRVVYHGTDADFEAFEAARGGSNTRDPDAKMGFFFTSSPNVAEGYARLGNGDAALVPAYLSIQNPYLADMRGTKYDPAVFAKIIETAKEEGRDGVILNDVRDGVDDDSPRSGIFVAFKPTQIKSVFNGGGFDPTDDRISFKRPPLPGPVTDAQEKKVLTQALTQAMSGDAVSILGLVPGRPLFKELGKKLMAAQMDGVVVHIAPYDFNFVGLMVADDGDGTVSITLESIGTGPVVRSRRPITLEGGSTTVAAAEEGHALHFSNPLEATITIPTNAVAAIPIGAEMELVRMGVGPLNITAAAGVVLNGVDAGTTNIVFRYGSAVIRKIDLNTWLVMGAIEEVTGDIVEPPIPLPTYRWADVFANHTATPVLLGSDDRPLTEPGENWTGWGTSEAQPIDRAVDFFWRNVIGAEAPDGAILELHSPTDEMHLAGRLQAPARSIARNLTIDLTGQTVLRGHDGAEGRWGQFWFWGEKVNDPAIGGQAVVDADAAAGTTSLILRDDEDTDALMSVLDTAAPGSIIEIRTNTTSAGYHPLTSRTTCFVQSVDPATREVTLMDPLEINVPRNNPVGAWETSDPSTVALLQGSLLTANAAAGATNIVLANALGLAAGDWLLIRTEELPGPGRNQWFDDIEPNFDSDLPDFDITTGDFGTNLVSINEEIHQIAAVTGNTVTIVGGLGKNKLVAWRASALKIDPIENLTVQGGTFLGQTAGADAAWDHQYVWTRYLVGSTFRDMSFDTDPARGSSFRRTGQAVRFDTGDGNVMDNLNIGAPQSIDAGEGYGVSFRLGERNSVIRNSYIEGCRHSIEYWASSGGNVCHDNHCHNDTSSSIDTHGNWNVDVTIRDNLITRAPGGPISADGDGSPDAIRIGNNKFVFDENIKVLNNRVIGYDGNALSIVPGVQNVLVDGLEVDGCQRVLNLQPNSRHNNAITRNVVIRNVTADRWTDKAIFIYRDSGTPIFDGLTLENWEMGATMGSDDANPHEGDGEIDSVYLSGVIGLTLRNFHIRSKPSNGGKWAYQLRNLINPVFDNVSAHGAERGVRFDGDLTNVSGRIDCHDLVDEATVYLWWREVFGTKTGAITIGHNQAIGTGAGQVRTEDGDPAEAFTITNVAI